MDLHPSGPGLLCRALRGVLRLRAVERCATDSYVDEADPTAPLFVAIFEVGHYLCDPGFRNTARDFERC